MDTKLLVFGLLMMSGVCAMAATRYVVPPGGSGTPGGGYTSWDTAATNLQDAAAATSAGDTILVTNGVYYLTNQVTVTNFTIQSYNNGAVDREGTIINGDNYVGKPITNRCFSLGHASALVEGFTITNGSARTNDCLGGGVYISAGTLRNCLVTGNQAVNSSAALSQGGGVYATGAGSLVTNCDIVANSCVGSGGGVYVTTSAKLVNSRVRGNRGTTSGSSGGGVCMASSAVLQNNEVTGNSLPGGVGNNGCGVYIASGQTIRNCLVANNSGGYYGGGVGMPASGGVIESCTVVGNQGYVGGGIGGTGTGTIQIRNTICRGNTGSNGSDVGSYGDGATIVITNCCLATTNLANSTIIYSTKARGSGNISAPPSYVNAAVGDYRLWPWSAGVDAGTNQAWMTTATDLDGQLRISVNNLVDVGAYETMLSVAPNQYVAQGGQTPEFPYTNTWASAASNLSDTVNAGLDGATILISNGVYTLTNQIVVGNRTIKSYKDGNLDPTNTIIDGNNFVGRPLTNRCFFLNSALALVEGLTISNGYSTVDGGGVYITAGTLRDCRVTCNTSSNAGGGIFATGASSLITNCDVIANTAWGPGVGVYITTSAGLVGSRINNNRGKGAGSHGGGVYVTASATLNNCEIVGNTVIAYSQAPTGGGVCMNGGNPIRNCVIRANSAVCGGGVGGLSSGTIENCTIAGNSAGYRGIGIGASGAAGKVWTVRNTICREEISCNYDACTYVINNCDVSTTNILNGNSVPNSSGTANITTPPSYVNAAGGNYRLWPWSAGVDVGTNQAWMTTATDLDGQPRIGVNNLVDMGPYETTAGSVATQYVAQGGQTPVFPYTNLWASAASNIQDAAGAGLDGATILISNGVYTLNGQITVGNSKFKSYRDGTLDRDGTIVNGGYPNNTNRCFQLNSVESLVEGLTITNGYVIGASGGGVYMTAGTLRGCLVTGNRCTNSTAATGGGGVYATGASSVITNCDIIANVAFASGGGVYVTGFAKLLGSRVEQNEIRLVDNGYGPGVNLENGAVISHCEIVSNRHNGTTGQYRFGGGIWVANANTTLRNCLIVGNNGVIGGGIGLASVGSGGTIESCTIMNNTASYGPGIGLGGLGAVTPVYIKNTICRDAINSWYGPGNGGYPGIALYITNSCLLSTNISNAAITNVAASTTSDPQFVNVAAGNYRLKGASPCINTGFYYAWMTGAADLDGNPRISPLIDGTVDMGAYEFPVQQGSVFLMR